MTTKRRRQDLECIEYGGENGWCFGVHEVGGGQKLAFWSFGTVHLNKAQTKRLIAWLEERLLKGK